MTPPANAALAAAMALLLVTLGYLFVCAVRPFGTCRRCQGTGRLGSRIRRGCRRCHGTGLRIRAGRHAYNRLARIHRRGATGGRR